MSSKYPVLISVLAISATVAFRAPLARTEAAGLPRAPVSAQDVPGGGKVEAVAFGHEYRQDDCPSIAAAPDGSIWAAWLSFGGETDRVAIRSWKDGHWANLQWVPGSEGDNWLPQVMVDASNRAWAVWSQQVDGNWDIYARWFDGAKQEWGPLERLTSNPLPDINPRVWSDGKGKAALVWQGFRGKYSSIFFREFDGAKWLPELQVTRHAANDWEPAVALDAGGSAWIAYDTYENGTYDVYLAQVRGQSVVGPAIPVAATARFEAKATVAVDTANRVWVAWEEGLPNWGKDQGYIIRDRQLGAFLGGSREMKIRCRENGQWREPQAELPQVFRDGFTSSPHVFSDGRGGVWVLGKLRRTAKGTPSPTPKAKDGYAPLGDRAFHEYWATRFDGQRWSGAFPLPSSKGRMSTRVAAALDAGSDLWVAWPSDGRTADNPHRPIRSQVYAGMLPAPAAAGTAALKPAAEPSIEVSRPHPDEAADVRAIRQYRTPIAGKQCSILRGDLHRHTELSWDIGGLSDGSLQDFYRYMIDAASMDFGASTDHQGGAWPYWWWYTQKMTDMYHVPGAYVPLFGYERSAQFPFGHRNIFFLKRSDARVIPFFLKQGTPGFTAPTGKHGDEPSTGTPSLVANDTLLLFEQMRRQKAIAIPHTSGTNQGTDWRFYDPELDPVVEIFQGCRTSFEQVGAPHVAQKPRDTAEMETVGYQPEGMVSNAWSKGYKLGIIASSDHFSTHISYAMVYTDDPSRQGILDAIKKRHTYGATDNIILEVRMGEHFMGEQFRITGATTPLRVKARGTRAIVRVDVIRDSEIVHSVEPKQRDVSFEFADTSLKGQSGRHYYYVRLLQDDDMIAWSSPMFVTY